MITLVIVGVVAALTVPTMIAKYQKEQTVTRLKKAYSALSQTTARAIADNGPIKSWTVENGKTKEFVDKYMAPYLSVMKNCGYETEGACRFVDSQLNAPNVKAAFGSSWYKLFLQDGTALLLKVFVQTTTIKNITIPLSYVRIVIDINGQKGPNVYGKDMFIYNYLIQYDFTPVVSQCTEAQMEQCKATYKDYSGKFMPEGGTIASGMVSSREIIKSKTCNKTASGIYCAALIMADGWQIKDDYPW